MQLYLIRHGQSTTNARWDAQESYETYRSSDPTLTKRGCGRQNWRLIFLLLPNLEKKTSGATRKTGAALGLPTFTAA